MLACAWSASAAAQDPTLTLGRISRFRGDDREATYDYRATRPWWISYEDCIHDDYFRFPLTVTNPSNRLEVWAGNDNCIERRGNVDRGQCWLVATEENVTRTFTVDIPVRNIVLRDLARLSAPMALGENVCRGSTDSDGNEFDLYFLIEDGGKARGPGLTWSGSSQGTGFDLVGPEPPDDIRVGIGDERLILSIRGVSEDLELERFGAFCVNTSVPSNEVEADAGADAGGTSEAPVGVPAPPECFTPVLRSGGEAPVGQGYDCGEVNKSSGNLRTKRLENDVVWAVGVAGEDVLGNPGPLSQIKCGTPRELDDFYELYSDAGGKGGGGFCSMSSGAGRAAPGATLLLGVLLAALGGRRAKRSA